ncbi:MAG: SIS domain-containing protein [Planctomycetota bacterium]|jgi:arabinose-5-phosphate isomerase
MARKSIDNDNLMESERVAHGRRILRAEAAALEAVADRLDHRFEQAIDMLAGAVKLGPGRIAITGVGKSADVGQKIAGTLNSTGTRAYFLDPTRAVHGDLGMVHASDVALVLSHSGESEEVLKLLDPLADLCAGIVAVTARAHSTLAARADIALVYGPLEEVCPLGLAPSASTTAMIALGDALAFGLSRERSFTPEEFARFHPAGSLGRRLARVEKVMRRGDELRLAPQSHTIRQVFAEAGLRGRRTGALMLLDGEGRLAGIFTDSDLARLIERREEHALDEPVRKRMTASPATVPAGTRVEEALELMRRKKISELPVIDADGRPVGILDITDLLGLSALELGAAGRRHKEPPIVRLEDLDEAA